MNGRFCYDFVGISLESSWLRIQHTCLLRFGLTGDNQFGDIFGVQLQQTDQGYMPKMVAEDAADQTICVDLQSIFTSWKTMSLSFPTTTVCSLFGFPEVRLFRTSGGRPLRAHHLGTPNSHSASPITGGFRRAIAVVLDSEMDRTRLKSATCCFRKEGRKEGISGKQGGRDKTPKHRFDRSLFFFWPTSSWW